MQCLHAPPTNLQTYICAPLSIVQVAATLPVLVQGWLVVTFNLCDGLWKLSHTRTRAQQEDTCMHVNDLTRLEGCTRVLTRLHSHTNQPDDASDQRRVSQHLPHAVVL